MMNTCNNTTTQKGKFAGRICKALDICAVIVLVACAAYLARGIYLHQRSNQLAEDLQNIYRDSQSTEDTVGMHTPSFIDIVKTAAGSLSQIGSACAESALPTEEPLIPADIDEAALANLDGEIIIPEEPVIQEQFTELYERNNDLVGWIHVNENIDYPIVWRDEDNDFYMDHDYDLNYSDDGWIFLDKRNLSDMSDDQLLIYGHNMRAGTMFGELDHYRELDFVRANPIIEVQSIYDEEPGKYVIVSLYDASMNKSHSSYIKITHFDFETPEAKQEYIDAVCARSIFELPCEAVSDDQLITLVTCSYSQPNGRFLVVARKLREDETAEQIMELFAVPE